MTLFPTVAEADRFWPSLYDRLRRRDAEGIDDFFVDSSQLRTVVKRDLETLLNATALESTSDLSGHPKVRESVLNYGLPDLTGKIISGLSAWEIQESLRAALTNYEPRIVHDSLSVQVDTTGVATSSARAYDPERGLTLAISGTILGTPMPESIFLQTRWDVERNELSVEME